MRKDFSMKKKLNVVLALGCVAGMMVTGCGSLSEEVSKLDEIPAANVEATADNTKNLTYTEEQSMIYSEVADRTLLDLSALDSCDDAEIQQVVTYMESVNAQLTGMSNPDLNVLDNCLSDYLLCEFQKTPNYWQRTQMIIRGIDAESRSVVVDVKYKTINFPKTLRPASKIVLGEDDYQKRLQIRYMHYINILQTKYGGNTNNNLEQMVNKFDEAYGNVQAIYDAQSNDTLTQTIYKTGNQLTYEGLIDNENEQTGATMTVRYILVPDYVLGVNLGIKCKHAYVVDYALDNDFTAGRKAFTEDGYATVSDSVYSHLYSYFKCLDEADYRGLYKLVNNFGAFDMHYQDVFETTYQKHANFTLTLFSVHGSTVECGVTVSDKIRPRGSQMTFPSYSERYYMRLGLIDGKLKILDCILISRKLEGEPEVSTKEAGITGFSQEINLNNEDRKAIEQLICDFSALQLRGPDVTTSAEFGDVVDTSISRSQMTSLQNNMTSLGGVRKVVWLATYQQGTSNYASVQCRELYQADTNAIVEANVVYEFIYKGNRWYVYNYTINNSVKLDTTNLQTTGSLCLVSPGNVDSYTSQIKGTSVESTESVKKEVPTYDYKETTPILKSGIVEQGNAYMHGDTITPEIFAETAPSLGITMTFQEFYDFTDELKRYDDPGVATNASTLYSQVMDFIAIQYNINHSYYNAQQLDELRANFTSDASKTALEKNQLILNALRKIAPESDAYKTVLMLVNAQSNFLQHL